MTDLCIPFASPAQGARRPQRTLSSSGHRWSAGGCTYTSAAVISLRSLGVHSYVAMVDLDSSAVTEIRRGRARRLDMRHRPPSA